MAAAMFFLVTAVLLSFCMGTAALSLSDLKDAVINGPGSGVAGRIFWFARLPRTLATVLAGAALAVSGAVIQSVLANNLASPGIIGVNAGAGLAVTICCAVGAVSGWAIAGAAFAGAGAPFAAAIKSFNSLIIISLSSVPSSELAFTLFK